VLFERSEQRKIKYPAGLCQKKEGQKGMTSQVHNKHSEVTPFGKDLEQWQENGQ
jgi:hypothetical protein